MDEMFRTLPQHPVSLSKGRLTHYNYQDYWNNQGLHEGAILAQETFKAHPSDILICSCPKTGTTWLKALAFAIVTRSKFDKLSSPLLTFLPHDCIPLLEKDLKRIQENHNLDFPLVATHVPYASLPDSVIAADCKIVYIYRNIKDVVISYHHFTRQILKLPEEDAPLEETFDDFCQGISWCGPYWDHILGYWKASKERAGRILLLKYEDLKKNTVGDVKRLAEFMGYPFSDEEEKEGVVDDIIKLCSFENLSNLEVNKTGKHRPEGPGAVENRVYFRKAKDGDWENYFTEEMKERIDKLIEEKLSGTGLVLK